MPRPLSAPAVGVSECDSSGVSRTDPQGAVAVFSKMNASDSWTLESCGLVPEPGLTVQVPLPGLAPAAHPIASSQYGTVQ